MPAAKRKTSPKRTKTSVKRKTSPKRKTSVKRTTSPKRKTSVKRTTSPKRKTSVKRKTSPKRKTSVKRKTSPKRTKTSVKRKTSPKRTKTSVKRKTSPKGHLWNSAENYRNSPNGIKFIESVKTVCNNKSTDKEFNEAFDYLKEELYNNPVPGHGPWAGVNLMHDKHNLYRATCSGYIGMRRERRNKLQWYIDDPVQSHIHRYA